MELHNLEKQVLLALEKKHSQGAAELAKATGLDEASVNHAMAWLDEKKLVEVKEKKRTEAVLGKEGAKYLKEGLPERRALDLIKTHEIHHKKPLELNELKKHLGSDANIAIVWLRKTNSAYIDNGKFKLTPEGEKHARHDMPQEKVLKLVHEGKEVTGALAPEMDLLAKRGDILQIRERKDRTVTLTDKGKEILKGGVTAEAEISRLTPEIIKTGKWKKERIREYDTSVPVKQVYPGRRHFINQAIDYARRVWLEMGFKEMAGDIIQTSFWNFDALFVPQDHPAREMQDTFFIEGKGDLPPKALVGKVKKAHEGGVAGSLGWRYEWDPEEARKLVLRTHTTVLSAQTLDALKEEDRPAKFFTVGRCFRNETVDWSHLFEFNQTDGIVVDENANLRHLIGYLKRFCDKLGYKKTRFRPAYFPYTEPSLEFEVFHPVHKKWIELGGAGIFRPEVTEPLLGSDVPVLAWGPGFDRMVTEYYKINDLRELYKNDVQQLRTMKQWMW